MTEKDLAKTLRRIVENQTIEDGELDLACHKLEAMISEAEEFGISKAEVIKAVFRTVWAPEQKCGCPQCSFSNDGENKKPNSNGAAL